MMKLKAAIRINACSLHLRLQLLAKYRITAELLGEMWTRRMSRSSPFFINERPVSSSHNQEDIIIKTHHLLPSPRHYNRADVQSWVYLWVWVSVCVCVCAHPDVMMPPLMTAFLIKPLNANEFRPSGRQLLRWPGRVTAPHPHIKIPRPPTRTFAVKMNICWLQITAVIL